MRNIKIAGKIIGDKQPVFIIAEAGVNHNGDLNIAKKLVDVAVNAGADAVKFQTFKSEKLTVSDVKSPDYANKNLGKETNQLDMLKKYELEYTDFEKLKQYCDKKGIVFLSTPHSFDAIDFLEKLVSAYKFGSGDITNIPALKHAAEKGKPMILGTGMSTMQEVKTAVNAIKSVGNNQIVVLHCTTNYPSSSDEVNLNAMVSMKKELNCLVGYSDHTLSILVPSIAAVLGAVILEKHFTIDKKLPGPDHKASIEPEELKEMIKQIREAEKILGSFEKKPTKSEGKNLNLVRKSIVAKEKIEKGTEITEKMLDFKRPGTGIKPSEIDEIVGKKAKITIQKNEILKTDMVDYK